ncbi:MAG: Lipoprotein LpqB, GerMN domain protein [Parcubacteria group bacterium GW2011_GWA2_47_26]|nr:MAG: Lipoprotein LpqB, GerMN domain protein [Parcubacteria group bacterium GW2011_GWA2_47_26]
MANVFNIRKPIELVVTTVQPNQNPSAAIVNTDLEAQAPPEIWSEGENISVRMPQPDSLVTSPLIVEGLARTFESDVVLRLKDDKGEELVKTFTTANAPDAGLYGPYRAELIFEKPRARAGTLEVFELSAKDGSEINKVTVPVRFE